MKFFNLDGLKAALPYIFLITGITLFTSGTFVDFSNPKIGEYTAGLGATILSGGIFAFLIKSYQFMGLFKGELHDIIYSAEHLKKRKDLPEIWEDVSKILFKDKFPALSKAIMHDVKNIYFPTDQISYCDDFKQTIYIDLIDPDQEIVKVIQQSEYVIFPTSTTAEIDFSLKSSILFNKSKNEVSFYVKTFKVNGVDEKVSLSDKAEGNALITSLNLKLCGKESYKIESEFVKEYCLKYDNIIGFRRESIINNMNVKIFTKKVTTSFLSMGTLKSFIKKDSRNHEYSEFEYKGIIYPRQGYTIFIRNEKK